MESIKCTKANLNDIISWSSSKYNDYKKSEVINEIIFLVEQGKDCEKEYRSGVYSYSALQTKAGFRKAKWTGGNYTLTIKNGNATLSNYVSDVESHDIEEIILEKPKTNRHYRVANIIKVNDYPYKHTLQADIYKVIGQNVDCYFVFDDGMERHVPKKHCEILE